MKKTSPIKWVGSKYRILPTILSYLPTESINFFEPFFGGGTVFFEYGFRARKHVFINDLNLPLMNMYREIRDNCQIVLELVEEYSNGRYEDIRDEFNLQKNTTSTELAALFICLNTMCFNGVYRENKQGNFNVPVGKNTKGHRNTCDNLDYERFRFAGRLLAGVEITNSSFNPWPFSATPGLGDVVFYDPAYLKEFSQYDKSGFTADDHKALAAQALIHAESGATVIVCGSNNDASRAIYGEPTKVVELSRTVGHSKRKKATEAIWVYNGIQQD